MKVAIVLASCVTVLATLLPQVASAQAMDAASGRQAIVDLSNEVVASKAWALYRRQEVSCLTLDQDTRNAALSQLNGFDQRATALADSLSGGTHAQGMALVRSIEDGYYGLLNPVVRDSCYVAPGA